MLRSIDMKKTRSTHKIRKSTNILTFYPWFEKKLLESHPWAMRVIIHDLLKFTNAKHDHFQSVRMTEEWKKGPYYNYETDYTQLMQLRWMAEGFRILDTDLEKSLDILSDAAKKILGHT